MFEVKGCPGQTYGVRGTSPSIKKEWVNVDPHEKSRRTWEALDEAGAYVPDDPDCLDLDHLLAANDAGIDVAGILERTRSADGATTRFKG